ncbi:MAG: hypothetical protein NZM44_01325 [Candidatus Calescibacterium sp.]|nr:hypothetical protein [Candidatus Calescibacterium sp.]
MVMPGRTFNSASYRFGFNGQERVPELHAAHTTALFWEYDGRLGRRWNVDPVVLSSLSAFSVFDNNPINYTDILGDKFTKESKKTLREFKKHIKSQIIANNNEIKNLKIRNSEQFDLVKKYESFNKDLKNALMEIRQLKKSSQVYNIKFDSNIPNDGVTEFDSKTGYVNVVIRHNGQNNLSGVLGHELKHAYQFEIGNLSLMTENADGGSTGGVLYDINDELEAYQREQSLGFISPEINVDRSYVANQDERYMILHIVGKVRDVNTISPNGMSYGDIIRKQIKESAEQGKPLMQVIKGWQLYYKR